MNTNKKLAVKPLPYLAVLPLAALLLVGFSSSADSATSARNLEVPKYVKSETPKTKEVAELNKDDLNLYIETALYYSHELEMLYALIGGDIHEFIDNAVGEYALKIHPTSSYSELFKRKIYNTYLIDKYNVWDNNKATSVQAASAALEVAKSVEHSINRLCEDENNVTNTVTSTDGEFSYSGKLELTHCLINSRDSFINLHGDIYYSISEFSKAFSTSQLSISKGWHNGEITHVSNSYVDNLESKRSLTEDSEITEVEIGYYGDVSFSGNNISYTFKGDNNEVTLSAAGDFSFGLSQSLKIEFDKDFLGPIINSIKIKGANNAYLNIENIDTTNPDGSFFKYSLGEVNSFFIRQE